MLIHIIIHITVFFKLSHDFPDIKPHCCGVIPQEPSSRITVRSEDIRIQQVRQTAAGQGKVKRLYRAMKGLIHVSECM